MESITTLNLSGRNLDVLPDLPSTLDSLDCYDNNLTSLPDRPPTLEILLS